MKATIELPRKVLYIFLSVLMVVLISISIIFLFSPQKVNAEWNSDNASTSDSYTLSQIEKHLGDLVDQLEKLNDNLSDIEDEMEKIRNRME